MTELLSLQSILRGLRSDNLSCHEITGPILERSLSNTTKRRSQTIYLAYWTRLAVFENIKANSRFPSNQAG